ncbi:MAG: matrixin family metalloprotease [Gammaproteobacteria bacterium]|nr:matrixin family metalloprotease [Gammaproteobacteria bacterium]
MNRRIAGIFAAAALAGAGGGAFAWQPLFDDAEALPLRDNRLVWQVWVPGESDDGDAWDPLFHDSVRYWNAEIPWFDLSATTRNNEDCTNGSSRNQVNTATWRETNCGGGSMLHAAGWAQTFLSGFGDARVIDEGDVYFNETFEHAEGGAEQMVFDETSFYSVALHEIGHNLGLGHGIFDGAVMAYGPTHKWHKRLSPDDICGVAVVSGNRGHCPIGLGAAVTLSGAGTEAHFSGYASADAGSTAREALRPWQEFNIYTTVLIDPAHRYRAGNLHVVAETEAGEFYARNAGGEWRPWSGGELPPANESDYLGHAMELVILGRNGISRGEPIFDPGHGYRLYREALTGMRLGLEGVKLKFWVAYSTEAAPDDLVYGSEPIRVEWTLE